MTIGCIVQARMGSSRLPGKVMMPIDGEKPILHYVISQLRYSKMIEKLIVATTTLKNDDVVEKYVDSEVVDCYRGSADDVLDRYYQCAKKFSLSIIVRVTSDDPLIDPIIVDQTIAEFKTHSYDYVSNKLFRTFPQGTEAEVFSFVALENAWKNAKKPSEREHVTPYFYNNPDKFKIHNVSFHKNISNLRWTVDRLPDLEFVRVVVSKIKHRPILMNDIIHLLEQEPDLMNINKDHILDEGYVKSLKEDQDFQLTKFEK